MKFCICDIVVSVVKEISGTEFSNPCPLYFGMEPQFNTSSALVAISRSSLPCVFMWDIPQFHSPCVDVARYDCMSGLIFKQSYKILVF